MTVSVRFPKLKLHILATREHIFHYRQSVIVFLTCFLIWQKTISCPNLHRASDVKRYWPFHYLATNVDACVKSFSLSTRLPRLLQREPCRWGAIFLWKCVSNTYHVTMFVILHYLCKLFFRAFDVCLTIINNASYRMKQTYMELHGIRWQWNKHDFSSVSTIRYLQGRISGSRLSANIVKNSGKPLCNKGTK